MTRCKVLLKQGNGFEHRILGLPPLLLSRPYSTARFPGMIPRRIFPSLASISARSKCCGASFRSSMCALPMSMSK